MNVASEMRKATGGEVLETAEQVEKRWIRFVLRCWQLLRQVTGFVFSNPHFRAALCCPLQDFL